MNIFFSLALHSMAFTGKFFSLDAYHKGFIQVINEFYCNIMKSGGMIQQGLDFNPISK